MANNESDNDAAQVYLLGKTYLANNQGQFFIRNDPIAHMAAGDRHTIIVTESGRAFAFGDNSSGQLGLGHTKNVEKVSCIKSLKFGDSGERVVLAACGRESSLVATNRGSLYSFGSNSRSQLGIETSESTTIHTEPVKIEYFKGRMNWKQISMGAEHACALRDDGKIFIWGANDDGQCGQPEKQGTIKTPRELRVEHEVNAM
jgi:alpha-tubulin suppressor-like RCC1 family protein